MRSRVLCAAVLAMVAWPVASAAAKCPASPSKQTVSQAPPPADLAARLEILRRPQADADRATIEAFEHDTSLRILYASTLRLLRSDADGTTWYLYAGKTRAYRYAHSCLKRMPASLRRSLLRNQERSIRQARRVRFGVFQFSGSHSGGWFGGDLRALSRGLTTLTVARPRGGGSRVSALVPDGVASVDVTFGDGSTQTAAVTSNFWKVEFGGAGLGAMPRHTVWKATDGSVVRSFRARR